METIAQVKFVGKNITRSGNIAVDPLPDAPAASQHRSVTYMTETDKDNKDANRPEATDPPTTEPSSKREDT